MKASFRVIVIHFSPKPSKCARFPDQYILKYNYFKAIDRFECTDKRRNLSFEVRARNRILGTRSVRDGRNEGWLAAAGEEREKSRGGLGCTTALFATMTNERKRFRAVFGF